MTNFGRSRGIAQPARDAERTYRRNLRSVGPGYVQDRIPYRAGFFRQYGSQLAVVALFQTYWLGQLGFAFVEWRLHEMRTDSKANVFFLIVLAALWIIPAIFSTALPIVWWRRCRGLAEADAG